MRSWSRSSSSGSSRRRVSLACCLTLSAAFGMLEAAQLPKLSGTLVGHVRNSGGIAQMGATVSIFNRYEKLVRQVLTNEKGAFFFDGLSPDSYSVRVTLSSFVPAIKRGIAVQAGIDRVLNVNLTSIFSTIELVYEAPSNALMTEDWKWALRTAIATRPVLRALPQIGMSTSRRVSMVTETKGLVNVSAGDPASLGTTGTQTDLGTAFALATSIYGRNQVQFSGNFGMVPNAAMPAAAFRSTYKRTSGGGISSPEITVTGRQVYLPTAHGGKSPLSTSTVNRDVPALRTMSVSTIDRMDLTDALRIEYGFSLDSIAFIDRLNYFSPFARVGYSLGDLGHIQVGFSAGAPPAELMQTNPGETNAELRRDLAALSILPRVSLRDGRARVQRTRNIEMSYQKDLGKFTRLTGAVFHEVVSNAAVNFQGPEGVCGGDVLPDFGSRAAMFNVGALRRKGYMASVSQQFGDHLEASVAFGRGTALTADRRDLPDDSPETLRSVLRANDRSWASARVTVTSPRAGTKLSNSYGWTDYTAMMPGHMFLTQKALPETGWNMSIRQPVPGVPGMPGRIELTAEMRNMLAQGYMPLQAGSRRILLIQSPRAVRGGLSFIF
jgi:hypothetical protein